MENTITADRGGKKVKKFLITLSVVLGAFPAQAEFCDSFSLEDAQKIADYLSAGTKIIVDEFIDPHFVPQNQRINSVNIQKEITGYRVLINDKQYDLLYVYAKKNRDYQNTALSLKLSCTKDFVYGADYIPLVFKEKNTASKEKAAALRKEFEACAQNNTGHTQTTADMVKYNYEEAECYHNVGNQIIETFYSANAKSEKKVLHDTVKMIGQVNNSVILKSDYAKYDNGGTLNSVIVSGNFVGDVKNLILKYLTYVENEQRSGNL